MMTDSTSGETYYAVLKSIAELLLKHKYMGLQKSSVECMEHLVGKPTDASTSYPISVEFTNGNTRMSLSVDCPHSVDIANPGSVDSWIPKMSEDANGNSVRTVRLAVKLNHPTHGSSSPANTKENLEFWLAVTELGQAIEDEFCGEKLYSYITMTKEEKAVAAKKRAEAESHQAYLTAIEENSKGQRLGGTSRQFELTPKMISFEGQKSFTVERNRIQYFYNAKCFGYNRSFMEFWLVSKASVLDINHLELS